MSVLKSDKSCESCFWCVELEPDECAFYDLPEGSCMCWGIPAFLPDGKGNLKRHHVLVDDGDVCYNFKPKYYYQMLE